MEFLTALLLVAMKYGRKVFGDDDEKVCMTQTSAWFLWHTAPEEFKHLPPSHWAQLAVRRVIAGRDLPGVKSYNDPMDRNCQLQPGMPALADRRPGPLAEAIHAEHRDRFANELTERERRVYELIQDGVSRTDEMAARLGVTSGAISQTRRKLAERYARLADRKVK